MEKNINSIFLACVFVFPCFLVSIARARNPKRREAALNEAIRNGHVVTAVLKNRHSSVDDPYSRSANGLTDKGIYEYSYKGKTYKYNCYSDSLPSTLTLYFVKNPGKAVEAHNVAASGTNWLMIGVLAALVLYLLL